jgi:thiol:disulfide interchange protein DsbA
MKLIPTLLCAFALMGLTGVALAEPKDGVDFRTLPVAQATESGKKVEVTEFFAYYCPHCHVFEPALAAWVKKQGENIVFKRVHVANGPSVAPQQRLWATLDALGLLNQYHDQVFAAMHEQHNRLGSDDAVFAWAEKAGIDKARFVDTYRSFGVQGRLRRADAMMADYKVNEWPIIAIDGRFETSPSIANQAPGSARDEAAQQQVALQVMDYLVAKAKAEKK